MKGECSMTALEASRLIDWLKAHGHTDEEATQCIKCIAGVLDPATGEAKKQYRLGSPHSLRPCGNLANRNGMGPAPSRFDFISMAGESQEVENYV